MIAPQVFVKIFTSDASLAQFAAPMLRIYLGGLGLFGIQIACQMTFVSIGNALCSVIVAVMRKFVLLLPLIYIMPRIVADKTMGVYMAEPIADIIAVTFGQRTLTVKVLVVKETVGKDAAAELYEVISQ